MTLPVVLSEATLSYMGKIDLYITHSADRSIKLSGSHRTQTQTTEVR